MRKTLNYFLVFVLTAFFAGNSCEYQKILKSGDSEKKFETAMSYYEKKDYTKAMTLFEQLVPVFRGTDKGEKVSYYFAYCNYYLRDYIMAGHHFRKFYGQFQNSVFAEESSYMSAYCYYLDAPKPSLDQETTRKAIVEFELFIGRYPTSEKIESCYKLIDELRGRLELKSYENAFLYYKIGNYKAAVVSLRNSLKEFPDSDYREDIMFYTIKSNYLYAINSVYGKTAQRLRDTLKDYKVFAKAYPNSKHSKEINKIYDDITKKLEILN